MIKYDSHLHIGDVERCYQIISNSKYKEKYKLYSAIDIELIRRQNEFINTLEDFFAIPIVFKEIDIEEENNFVRAFCSDLGKGIPVSLISTTISEKMQYCIFKEHFLLHDYLKWEDRLKIYQYINDHRGFLIIHCKDKIRMEYLKLLNEKFPNINYIVAHLGRDVNESTNFIEEVLKTFHSPNFYFDVSTIKNFENILLASKIVRPDRLLFGSDYPYCSLEEINYLRDMILNNLPNAEAILTDNFITLRRQIGKN